MFLLYPGLHNLYFQFFSNISLDQLPYQLHLTTGLTLGPLTEAVLDMIENILRTEISEELVASIIEIGEEKPVVNRGSS